MAQTRRVDLHMPLPVLVQTGVVAAISPVVTDSFWEWFGVVVCNLAGWGVLFVTLILLAREN
jgi:hypothetical protein